LDFGQLTGKNIEDVKEIILLHKSKHGNITMMGKVEILSVKE
jgi:hypothetical protein